MTVEPAGRGRAAADQHTIGRWGSVRAGTAIVDFFVGARYPSRNGNIRHETKAEDFRGEYSETCTRKIAFYYSEPGVP